MYGLMLEDVGVYRFHIDSANRSQIRHEYETAPDTPQTTTFTISGYQVFSKMVS
jgi:hypothetical protein